MNGGDNGPTGVPAMVARTDKLRDLIMELEEVQRQVMDKIGFFKNFTGEPKKGKEPDGDKEKKEKFANASIDGRLHSIADRLIGCIKEEGFILERLKELV